MAKNDPSFDIALLSPPSVEYNPTSSQTFTNQKCIHFLPPEIILHPPLPRGRVT